MATNLSAYCRPVDTPAAAPPPPPPSSFNGGAGGGSSTKRPFSGNGGGGGQYNNDGDGGDDDEQQHRGELKRRCIDYHTPAVLDLTSRLYRKPNRRMHTLPGGSGSAGYS